MKNNGLREKESGDEPPHSKTPAQLGYRWPAEWEPHEATWIAWPHNRETWPGKFERIPPAFAHLIATIAEWEPVFVLAGGAAMSQAESLVGGISGVTLQDIETNDAWVRDYGPTFLAAPDGRSLALVDWQYNAWGEKYPPWDKDAAVGRKIASVTGCQRFPVELVLEGGAIEGNGRGTILTTTSCLLHPNRNGKLSRQEVERHLSKNLSAEHVLWISDVELAGDDTDGHIDQLARFVDPKTIVFTAQDDGRNLNRQSLRRLREQLESIVDQDGERFRIIPLPMPRVMWKREYLPASYANFYIANGTVIVPQFNDRADADAIDILEELFPDREVFGFPSVELVLGLGSIHCLTQQQPACG